MAVTDFPYQAYEEPDQEPGGAKPSMRDRLVPPMQGSPLWGWLGPLIVAAFGAFLRFDRLGTPKAVVFDETYYAKDAFSLLKFGVERQFVDNANNLLLSGNTAIFKQCDQVEQCASYVVHPPLGKWMIALGDLLYDFNPFGSHSTAAGFDVAPFGWRLAAALFGALSIFILARVALRMTRSTVLGCLAGLLLSLDGLHFVLSRTALLDIFLMFWILAGFACLVADRDWARGRLADWYESAERGLTGPRLGLRPWRLAAGLCLGAALATKWTGVFFIIAFAIMSVVWDAGARRMVGLRRPYSEAFRLDVPLAFAWTALAPIVVYMASFAGWFATDKGYGRNWEQATSSGPSFFVIDSLRSWLAYQKQVLGFHTGLESTHPYQSEPWSWPLLLRPVAFFYESPTGCGAPRCSWAVLGTGTPVIWYGGLIALIAMIAWYTATRDWRAGAVLVGYAAGWLPWFYFAIADNRTMFLFYALPMLPFMILAIVLAFGLLIGPADSTSRRRVIGAAAAGAFTLLVLVNFRWLYPVIAADLIPYQDWYDRMLFRSWI